MSGDYYFDKTGARSSGTGVGTNSGVTVTIAAIVGSIWTIQGIQCSGDAAAVVTIESPANTVIWQKRFAAAFTMSENFDMGELQGTLSAAALVKVSASTSHSEANIQAIELKES